MARRCEITGKGTRFGNNVSHSNRKTRRTFKANVHKKRIYIPEEQRWVTMHLSTRAMRDLQKKGYQALVAAAKKAGTKR